MSYQPNVYKEQGGSSLVVRAADGGVIKGQATANGAVAQAAAVADITVTGTYATDDDAIETAVNGILAALRNVGIIAAS